MRFFVFLFALSIFIVNLNAGEKEDLLKGVILERISQFITYNDDDNFLICVYKDKKMSEIFKNLFKTRRYKNYPIEVKSLSSLDDIAGCDIFYAQNITNITENKILAKKQTYTLLTTNDIRLLNDGFMLALYIQDNKIHFAINHKALLDAKLKINYRLLKVASKVVNPVKN